MASWSEHGSGCCVPRRRRSGSSHFMWRAHLAHSGHLTTGWLLGVSRLGWECSVLSTDLRASQDEVPVHQHAEHDDGSDGPTEVAVVPWLHHDQYGECRQSKPKHDHGRNDQPVPDAYHVLLEYPGCGRGRAPYEPPGTREDL